jgi:hypothetical protein
VFPGANTVYHRINTLGSKVVVDSNILLDASFNINGFSRSAIYLLHLMGYYLLCDKKIYREACKILKRKRKRFDLEYEPLLFLDKLLNDFSFNVVSFNSEREVKKVNKYDRHVAQATIEQEAFLLTNDLDLYHECIKSLIPVRFPWHVVNEYNILKTGHPGKIINLHPPHRKRGFVFARIIPGGWDSSLDGDNKFTVVEIENLGKLFYSSSCKAWCFNTAEDVNVKVEHKFSSDDVITLLVNFDIENKELLELRSCHNNHPDRNYLCDLPNESGFGTVTIGHDLNNINHLDGMLSTLVTGHKTIGKDTFKMLCKYKEAIPNPWDKGMLDFYLKKCMVKKHKKGFEFKYFKPDSLK